MKVLTFLPYVPFPPNSGGRQRSWNLLLQLSKKHELTLVCFIKPEESDFLYRVRTLCKDLWTIPRALSPTYDELVKSSENPTSVLLDLYSSSYAKQILTQLLLAQTYDIIHVETFYIYQNLPESHSRPVVLVESNIEYLLMEQSAIVSSDPNLRQVYLSEAEKQAKMEKEIWRKASRCAAVTDEDARTISEQLDGRAVWTIPNGVDKSIQPVETKQQSTAKLLFIGNFSHLPNVDGILYFLNFIFPLIKAREPHIHVDIIGPNPPREVRQWATQAGIDVHGYVHDLRPAFENSSISICPIRIGSGSRTKILEALCYGHPIVTTSVGCAGLALQHGEHYLIADDPQTFAGSVYKLIHSPTLRASLARRGRETVVERYDWELSAKRLDALYRSVVYESKSKSSSID
jgi:polysaccharide biosynthesis protein PslH